MIASPAPLRQAQYAELVELKRAIHELRQSLGRALEVLDVGIGDARILQELVGIDEIWASISKYDGIDVAQNCVDISSEVIAKLGLESKASTQLLDAIHLDNLEKTFDLIISTWFTAGNFYPSHYSVEAFEPGMNMAENDKFTSIFKKAYDRLNPGGEIIIGSMYIDNEATRQKQEAAYRGFGWEVITDERDCFTASREGWWSQRFTKERVYDYLNFVPRENISFIALDTYDYAMMLRLKKPAQ